MIIKIEKGLIKDIINDTRSIIYLDGKKYDFQDNLILPGFIDSHAHIYWLGKSLNEINLTGLTSKEKTIESLNNKNNKSWVVGRGWNQENWNEKIFPTKDDLDIKFPDTPVFLTRVDGHAAWVNSKTLEICGITQNTENPEGGYIYKNLDGTPSGILIDNAMELVRKFIPKETNDEIIHNLKSAFEECLKMGLTEIHDMDVHLDVLEFMIEMDKEAKIPINICSYIRGFDRKYIDKYPKPFKVNNIEVIGLKFYMDGALGSRGAAMIYPYKDSPNEYGVLLENEDELTEKVKEGCLNGWQIAIHAIGDLANRKVLNIYEKIRKAGFKNILRIEHCQHIHPDDITRFKELDIIASVQPIHCISDKKMAIQRLGANFKYSYPWSTFLKNDVKMIAGSDFPIESGNPFIGLDAFVNRIPFQEKISWQNSETISLSNALDAYTINSLKITNNNYNRGRIKKDFLANLVVIDNKELTIENLSHIKIISTISNGIIRLFN